MKTVLYTIFLFIGLISSSSALAQAKVEIKDAKKNFGFVKKGEVVKVNYEVKNIGTEPLIITDIEIGCSCTTSEYDKKPIPPGQTTTVTIIFDTHTVYDRQDRTVLLKTNDKSSPHKLRYKGVVLTN